MRRLELLLDILDGLLIGLMRVISNSRVDLTGGVFGDVSVVISLHLIGRLEPRHHFP